MGTLFREFKGTLFVDGFGRLYFDTCKTATEHTLAPATTPDEAGDLRRTCRQYLEDFLSPLIGKEGPVRIMVINEDVDGGADE